MTMITDWTEDMSAVFRKTVFTFSHDLAATNLFTDETLIKLIKKHPSELTDVCTMSVGADTRYPNKLRTGDFRECSAEELFATAQTGNCLLYTSPSPRDQRGSRMPSSA